MVAVAFIGQQLNFFFRAFVPQERVYEEKCIGENASQNLIAPPPPVPCPVPPMLSSPSGVPPPLPAKTIGRMAGVSGGGVCVPRGEFSGVQRMS